MIWRQVDTAITRVVSTRCWVAQHSETRETLVVYRPEYGDRSLWVRPLSMFQEAVETSEGVVPRFELIDAG